MEGVHFGGLMGVGMRDSLGMAYKVDMVYFIGKEDIKNIKVHGTMANLMEKAHNFSRMDRNMKGHLNKINSMDKVFFIKMIL